MFAFSTKLRQDAGFTFNEILAAMSIVVLGVMGYSLSSVNMIQRQTVSDRSTVAIHLAQDKLEELQALRSPTDVDLCPSGGDRAISAKVGVPGIYDRCWRIAPSPLGTNLKQVDVKVTWQDYEAREVTLSTLVFIGN
jgi:hypothetical protein